MKALRRRYLLKTVLQLCHGTRGKRTWNSVTSQQQQSGSTLLLPDNMLSQHVRKKLNDSVSHRISMLSETSCAGLWTTVSGLRQYHRTSSLLDLVCNITLPSRPTGSDVLNHSDRLRFVIWQKRYSERHFLGKRKERQGSKILFHLQYISRTA